MTQLDPMIEFTLLKVKVECKHSSYTIGILKVFASTPQLIHRTRLVGPIESELNIKF